MSAREITAGQRHYLVLEHQIITFSMPLLRQIFSFPVLLKNIFFGFYRQTLFNPCRHLPHVATDDLNVSKDICSEIDLQSISLKF
jgi:hypothetical protein